MIPHPFNAAQRLLDFNHQVLDQALALAAAHQAADAPDYARPTGAHLRHVIEHYEALLMPRQQGEVDYDSRARDAALERCPHRAVGRLLALQDQLLSWPGVSLDIPVTVRGQGGLAGDFGFHVASTVGRELVFLASHAVHHFALLQTHCRQHGIAISADFGKAPATVAHERAAAFQPTSAKETPCPAPLH